LPVPLIETLGVRAISSLKSEAALALSMNSRLIGGLRLGGGQRGGERRGLRGASRSR
jgi:hypothetical protein